MLGQGAEGPLRRVAQIAARIARQPNRLHQQGDDPGVVGSGKMQLSSVTTSKRGSPQLRKALFQVVSTYVKCKPENEAVYQFYAKKRDEGKPFFVCTTAAANKFLRIYYAHVKECLNAAESATQVEEG